MNKDVISGGSVAYSVLAFPFNITSGQNNQTYGSFKVIFTFGRIFVFREVCINMVSKRWQALHSQNHS